MSVISTGVFDNEMKQAVNDLLRSEVSHWQQTWFMNCPFTVDTDFNEALFCGLEVKEVCDQGMHESGIGIYTHSDKEANSLLQQMFNCDESTLKSLLEELNIAPLDTVYADFRSRIAARLGVKESIVHADPQVIVKAKLSWQGGELIVCLDSKVFECLLKQKYASTQSLASLVKAAQHSQIPMRVSLKSESINFVDVMCLKKGDVVMLKQEIEKPISIDVNHASGAVQGYLVERENNKAIIFSES
ncbi:FliM/FliN family flagellar motor switch protein [Pseudoalteromonas byunsanensis]|uniref:Flagellar motor switch protein FliN-like C-terminal domain-containing protein n=1 Tax=Pseudoalteromonas byunsanensis TaxID=327939 RepID=A0A1S1NCZ6_9GAMM|nr:FliM/FliN family flagellar motor switch protein [Pseudoalteromonas byunsanensis]OHU97345.1 hypothetical protein BIW53_03215 [Pseudoalteromonas byunsanensis]